MNKTWLLLGDQGTTFSNAFSTSPLCCPSRASILTGLYEHNTHVNTNIYPICSGPAWIAGPERLAMGVHLQKEGYRTSYFG